MYKSPPFDTAGLPQEALKILEDSGYIVINDNGTCSFVEEKFNKDSIEIVTRSDEESMFLNEGNAGDGWLEILIPFLLFLVVLLPILYLFKEFVLLIFKKPLNSIRLWLRYNPDADEKQQIITFLRRYSSYFVALEPDAQDRFVKRFYKFSRLKSFEFHYKSQEQNLDVLFACKELTRITFGFSDYHLIDFTDFNFHKDAYFMPRYNSLAYGHTSDRGYIYLASTKMREGVVNDKDGVNLLLHELAHAVYIQKRDIDFDKKYNRVYESWVHFAEKHVTEVKSGGETPLNNYAFNNLDEMLAVNTEFFFERPAEMKKQLPELFFFMKHLYNQDPLLRSNPVLKPDGSIQERLQEVRGTELEQTYPDEIARMEFRLRESRWLPVLIVCGIFVLFSAPVLEDFDLTLNQIHLISFIILITCGFMYYRQFALYRKINPKSGAFHAFQFILYDNRPVAMLWIFYVLYFLLIITDRS